MQDAPKPILFAGSSHRPWAVQVAKSVGVELGEIVIELFPDKEIYVQLLENVRGREVFVLQSIARHPNRYLMELMTIIDALKRASAKEIAAVMPYYGYARQDRKDRGRVPITAKLVADLLQTAGATRVLTMDLHAEQIEGFFNVPVDNLYGRVVLSQAVKQHLSNNVVVVAPDVGSIKIARNFAGLLGVDFATIDKRRISSREVEVTTVIGEIAGRDVLLADDMISTAGTLVAAAHSCKEAGCGRIVAAATHGLLVGKALDRIQQSPIESVYLTDTVPGVDELAAEHPKLKVASVAPLFGEVITRICQDQSISCLFR